MDGHFQERVREVLRMQGAHHLIPMFSHSEDMPERVNRHNPDYFLVFNLLTQKYEVHSIEHNGWLNSRQVVVPYERLDGRLEVYLQRYNFRAHGKRIFQELEESERKHEASKKREFHNFVESVGKDTRELFSGWKTKVIPHPKAVKKHEMGNVPHDAGHASSQQYADSNKSHTPANTH